MEELPVANSFLKIFNYDSNLNILTITLPQHLKIKIKNNVDLVLDDELNITCKEFNLLTLFKNIHLDSYDACIHLNSRKAKQLMDLNNLIQVQTSTIKSFSEILNNRTSQLKQLNNSLCKIT